MADTAQYRRPLILWGSTVGFGTGAIIDVVIFHLIFQHHHLLSSVYDPQTDAGLRRNITIDGLFIATMGLLTVLGAAMLWRTLNGTEKRLSARFTGGALILGGGIFNTVDGVVTHYVLDAHNVVHGTTVWNPPWVIVSLILLASGMAVLVRTPAVSERTRETVTGDP